MDDSGDSKSKLRLRLVPPPRDLPAESREALRRFRESVDLEDEPTQPEIHFHLDDLARAREAVSSRKPPSDAPLAKSIGKMIAAATAAAVAVGALAEAIREILPFLH